MRWSGTTSWAASGAPLRRLGLTLFVMFSLVAAWLLVGYQLVPHPRNDFFAFDSYSRFLRGHPPSGLYDQKRLAAFQGLPGHKLFAFMYPPIMLLLLWPLALIGYDAAYVLWVGIGVLACCAAVARNRRDLPLVLLMLVAPSTAWTALCGQSSLLVAALLIGGLRLSPDRPWLGGLLIGLAAYKPQLGLLVPVALIASRRWTAVLSASLTVLGLVGLSVLTFGPAVWPAWYHHLSSIVAVRTAHATDWATLLATVAASLGRLGVDRRIADAVQLGSFLLAAASIAWCFRPAPARSADHGLLPVAALGVATFLATPFAFIYDLPLLTAAVLLFAAERRWADETFLFREVIAMVAGLLLPWLMLSGRLGACSSLLVLAILGTILHRIAVLRSGTLLPTG